MASLPPLDAPASEGHTIDHSQRVRLERPLMAKTTQISTNVAMVKNNIVAVTFNLNVVLSTRGGARSVAAGSSAEDQDKWG